MIPLTAGLLVQMHIPLPVDLILMGCIVCLAGWMFPLLLSVRKRFAYRHLQGVCILGCVSFLAMLMMHQQDIRQQRSWIGYHLQDTSTLMVVLQEPPVRKRNSWKAEASVDGGLTGTMLLYFRTDPSLHYGDRLVIRAAVRRISPSGNPGDFDFSKYCAYKYIYHQAFLAETQWKQLPGNKGYLYNHWLIAARDHCLRTLRKYIPGREEYGIAQALLIGYREELDKEIVQAYTNTGVVHIIAISGLHLGLIYITLLQTLQWLPRKRWAGVLKALVLIFVLWAFSLLTGASASVLRSAVMFTTIAVGQFMLTRYSNIYNTLAAAAFLLLCYNPYFLVDAGFQLSFFAVGGILLCYRPLYDLLMIRNKWLDKLWQMIAVSLAAQVFTWPVCLYYFHQFPNVFLLANIVAVPLSTILLYGAILLVVLPFSGPFLGIALEYGIRSMNRIIQWLDRLPYAVTNNIQLDFYEMLCLYAITIFLCCWLLARWRFALYWCLSCICLHAGWRAYAVSTARQQELFIVHNLPRKWGVAYINGRNSYHWGDRVTASLLQLRIENSYSRQGELMQLGKMRMLRLAGRLPVKAPAKPIEIDYLLLSHNPPVNISRLQQFFTCRWVIFDATNTAFRIRKWKNEAKALPLRCFSVPDEGAFVVNL